MSTEGAGAVHSRGARSGTGCAMQAGPKRPPAPQGRHGLLPLRRFRRLRRLLELGAAILLGTAVVGREAWRERRAGRVGWTRALGRGAARACEVLGATFVKVGQIASTRSDILPPAFTGELARLRDEVAPLPFEDVRAAVEGALGAPLAALFEDFEPAPLGSASVAQVHGARLPGGAEVAVKVRRPGIREQIALDRALLLGLARGLERLVPSLRLVSLAEAVETFCEAVELQTDFAREARNNRRFAQHFADDPAIHLPKVHPELSGEAVLVMERIRGLREEELVGHPGVDLEALVRNGMRCICRMVFSHGLVHADLHPGNLRFLPPDRIALLDVGLVAEIPDRDRITNAELLFAFATGDGRTVARLFYENAPHRATPSYEAYEREVLALVEGVRRKGLAEVEIGLELARIFDILRRHRVQARAHMTLVNLALLAAEGLGKRLAPDLALAEAALPYLTEALAGARASGGGG